MKRAHTIRETVSKYVRTHHGDLKLLAVLLTSLVAVAFVQPAALGYAAARLFDSELAGVLVGAPTGGALAYLGGELGAAWAGARWGTQLGALAGGAIGAAAGALIGGL